MTERLNKATVINSGKIYIDTPRGSMSGLRWANGTLSGPKGFTARFNAEITAAFDAAVRNAKPADIEYKMGYEIHDGDREGWEFIGTVDDAHGQYMRVNHEAESAVVYFAKTDMI